MTEREVVAKALSDALAGQLGIAITLSEALRVLDAAAEIHARLAMLGQSVAVDAEELVIDVRGRG